MIIIVHTYNWFIQSLQAFIYIYEHRLYIHDTFTLSFIISPCFWLPSVPLLHHSPPFYLLGTLLAVTGSVNLVLRLLVN
jgi:hypothetical protein